MMKQDSNVDISNIAEESIRTISLHAKYLGLWQEEKTHFILLEESFKKMKRYKMEYYLGRLEDNVYISSPLNQKIPRQDLDFYLDSDDELCTIKRNMINSQNKIDLFKAFIDNNLNQRSHHFRNALAFLNWSQGN